MSWRPEMTMVVVPIGLPASGKSTWVKFELPLLMGVEPLILSYDIYRKQEPFVSMDNWKEREKLVKLKLQEDLIDAIDRGESLVALDNTNLSTRSLEKIRLAVSEYQKSLGGKPAPKVEYYIEDKFLDVPVLECIRRDTYREEEKRVGPEVIFRLDRNAHILRQKKSTAVRRSYVKDYVWHADRGRCIIVDLDGTLALLGDRSPFDGTKVGEDTPNVPVIGIVQDWIKARLMEEANAESLATPHVFFFTGRENQTWTNADGSVGDVRFLTERWIYQHVINASLEEDMAVAGMDYSLRIRAEGDHRPDYVVKEEMLNDALYPAEPYPSPAAYRVDFVLDDRSSVVHMWRNKAGLPCLQVAEGDF